MTVNLTDPIFTDEAKAREWFEAARWPNGPVCPHCGNAARERILAIPANLARKVRAGLYECRECHGQFTVQTGSVMESSHVPLTKWALAYRLLSGAKKGMSAHQLHRTIGVTYRTAWFMAMRIRESMRDVSGEQIGGEGKIVEADEAVDRRQAPQGQRTTHPQGRQESPVAVLVERGKGGRVRATVVGKPFDGVLKRNIAEKVALGTEIHSDDHKAYRGVEKITGGKHSAVKHMLGEYARDGVHNNTAESWNALLERSIVGASITSHPSIFHATATKWRSVGITAAWTTANAPSKRSGVATASG